MAVSIFEPLLKHLPAIATVTIMSIVLIKFVWKSKKRKMDFSEKAVLVTGCDSVYCFDIAKRMDKLGFQVFAGFLRPDGEAAQRLRSRTSSRLKTIALDVSDNEQVKTAFAYIRRNVETPGLYCLINNVTSHLYGDFEWYTMSQCQKVIDMNVTGTVRLIKHFFPLLKSSQGRIINITEVSGNLGLPQLSIYSAAKQAVDAFMECLQCEVSKFGITLTTIEKEDPIGAAMQASSEEIDDMWENMTEENKAFYKVTFDNWRKAREAKTKPNIKAENNFLKELISTVDDAVTSDNPRQQYIIASRKFKLYSYLMNVLPNYCKCKIVNCPFFKN